VAPVAEGMPLVHSGRHEAPRDARLETRAGGANGHVGDLVVFIDDDRLAVLDEVGEAAGNVFDPRVVQVRGQVVAGAGDPGGDAAVAESAGGDQQSRSGG